MSSLLDHFPAVSNMQTRTQALGMAVQGYTVHYLSTAGPGTACKSIWSSLVSPRGTLDCQPWGYDFTGASGLQTAYQTLPNSNFQHMVTLVKQTNFLICVDPQANPERMTSLRMSLSRRIAVRSPSRMPAVSVSGL